MAPIHRILAAGLIVPLSAVLVFKVWQISAFPSPVALVLATATPKAIGMDCLVMFTSLLVAKISVIMLCRIFSKAAVMI